MLARLRSFLKSVMRRQRAEREMDDEVRFHIDARTEHYVREGMSLAEARRRARLEFGAVDKAKEETREARGMSFFDSLAQDLRFGARMLRKSPGFTAIAIVTLALGIGANTAIFSAVNGILLEPMPYAQSGRLVNVQGFEHFEAAGVEAYMSFTHDVTTMILAELPDVERAASYQSKEMTLTGADQPQKIRAGGVSGEFFAVLGVRPLVGRPILASDLEPTPQRVAVLAYKLWTGSFGSDPGIVGKQITLDKTPYTVIGVMPPEFEFASDEKGVWTPIAEKNNEEIIARLKPGVTVEQTNAQLKVVTSHVSAKVPQLTRGWTIVATPVKRDTGNLDRALFILLGAVGFVLLIACANVSGLQLSRMMAREREIAIRGALGASRLRLVRQFLAESMMLAIAGGGFGLLLAAWGLDLIRRIAPAGTPRLDHLRLDPKVLLVTATISIFAGLLFGLAPALQAASRPPTQGIKDWSGSGAAGTGSRRPYRMRSALVVFEIALAVVLVVGATLLARSFEKLIRVPLGFRTDHIVTMSVNFSHSVCDTSDDKRAVECELVRRTVLDRITALHGVEMTAATSNEPFDGANVAMSLKIEGLADEVGLAHGTAIFYRPVTLDYFRALGMPLVTGRNFTAADFQGVDRAVIVNESFARRFFGGNALGHRIGGPTPDAEPTRWMEIVGVVHDTREVSLQGDPDLEYYVPFGEKMTSPSLTFLARTADEPLALASAIEKQVWSVDADAPITDVKTMDQLVAEQVAQPKFQTLLLGAFGFLGLALAVVGIYGVISYAVTQRTREIGIRMALGAEPRSVLRLIVGHGMLLAAVGIAMGAAGAFALTRYLASLLYEVKPGDPATFVAVAAGLGIVALVASYVPARRAMRVDPMVALRHE